MSFFTRMDRLSFGCTSVIFMTQESPMVSTAQPEKYQILLIRKCYQLFTQLSTICFAH